MPLEGLEGREITVGLEELLGATVDEVLSSIVSFKFAAWVGSGNSLAVDFEISSS